MSKPRAKKKVIRRNAADRLLRAAGKYIESRGGKAVIAGPIGIMDGDHFGKALLEWHLCIKIMGRKPTKPEPR